MNIVENKIKKRNSGFHVMRYRKGLIERTEVINIIKHNWVNGYHHLSIRDNNKYFHDNNGCVFDIFDCEFSDIVEFLVLDKKELEFGVTILAHSKFLEKL